MTELDTYLAQHFLNAEQFAAACALSEGELAALIQARLIPMPSYVVENSSISSHVFGVMHAQGSMNGEYFHPANRIWAIVARNTITEVGRTHAYEVLKNRFADNMHIALAELNAKTWRLRDSFTDNGVVIVGGLKDRIDSMWNHFLHGTFGLCVVNPISETAIARKEVLQEKLIALSSNGAKESFSEAESRTLLELIDDYAVVTKPFSPIEYPISSRKRLVEDLWSHINVWRAANSIRPASPS